MRKFLFTILLTSVLLVACDGDYKKQLEEDSITISQLTTDYNEAATFNDSLMLLMGDIYTGLDSINMQEGLLYNLQGSEHSDRRSEIRRNLSAIKARLAYNKQLLEQLEAKIKATGQNNTVLSKTIEKMKEHIDQQDRKVSKLEHQLYAAHDSISSLNNKIARTQEMVEEETEAKEEAQAAYQEAQNELNTVYYAIGTNKELSKNGLVEKKFLRSTKIMKGDFNEDFFTKEDMRTFTIIHTGAKKIDILTNMPESSYEIVDIDGLQTIKVLDVDKFWSLSRYLIVEIK